MVVQPPDGPLEDTSDLAALWNDALHEFKGTTQLDLTKFQFKSMQEAIDSTKAQSISFGAFRHDKGKVDAVRSAFGNNLNSIERIVKGAKMAADTAAVFPPALPGAALMTAFTFVFQTFKDVKADYDRVAGFFTEMEAFLDRVSMLETKSPKLGPFSRCVSKVFTGMLRLCSVAADYKGKGRFRKWLKNAVDGGQDPVLAGAYASVEDAIDKLGAAVGIATLRTVVEIKETTTKLDGKTDILLHRTADIGTKTDRIADGVSIIREGVENLDLRLEGVGDSIVSVNTTVAGIGNTLDRQHAVLISKLDSLLMQSPAHLQPSEKKKGDIRKADAGAKKHRALAQVKRHFADTAEARKKISAQCKDIDNTTIESTCTWIFQEEKYKQWLSGSERILWLSGDAGLGKTYLARSIALDVEKTFGEGKASIAHFFFREDNNDLRSFRNALRCSVLEIAERNATYCDLIAAEIANDADEEPWKQFFADRFPADAETPLYLVLDGVDEAFDADAAVMAEVLKGITSDRLNIHILFTSRSNVRQAFEGISLLEINVTKELVFSDMQKLTQARIKRLPRLHKFHRRTKKRIEEKIMQNADSMLYIEHMVRRLSAIGREGAVIKDIETSIPASLEDLYKVMLAECQKGRTEEDYDALRTLFATLAFSMRELTLEEATDLTRLADPGSTFDIEDELVGRSARILELAREQEDDDDGASDDERQSASPVDDSSIGHEVLEQSGKTPLSFQERSMREYFRSINVEENGLRTPPTRAHATVFVLLVKLLCDATANAAGGKAVKLQNYAAHFWLHHFCEIDIDGLTPEQFANALSGLHQVLSNEGNAALAIEKWRPKKYDELEKELSLRTVFQKWFRKAQDSTELNPTIKSWAVEHVKEPQKVFLNMARAHVADWFAESITVTLLGCFAYAKSALVASGVDIDPAFTGDKDIGQVLAFFEDIRPSATAFRAIANLTQNRLEHEKSIEFCDKGLALADADEIALRFRLLWIKAWSKERIGIALNDKAEEDAEEADDAKDVKNAAEGKLVDEAGGKDEDEDEDEDDVDRESSENGTDGGALPGASKQEDDDAAEDGDPGPGDPLIEEALSIIDQAMAILPSDYAKEVKLASAAENVLVLRALCQKHLGQYEEALKSFEEQRAIRKDVDAMRGSDLDIMFAVKDWSDEPQKAIDLVTSWTDKERMHFFEYLFTRDYFDGYESGPALQAYAIKAGDDAVETVIGWWQNYIKAQKRGSARTVAPKMELARFYRLSRNELGKAMDIYNDILKTDFRVDDTDSLEDELLLCRLDLADTILACFRRSSDPTEKLALLENMKKLPNLRTSDDKVYGNEDDWNESQTQVMLALMIRTVGSPVEYQQLLNKSFHTSIAGLSDSVGWNDFDSFRLLAKVLACVPGLERDAQIALSCQFSITDTSVQHGSDDKDADGAADAKAGGTSTTGDPHNDQNVSVDDTSQTTTITVEQKAGATEPTVTVAAELAKLTASSSNNDDVEEDLVPEDNRWLGCDGPCERDFSSWKGLGALYFCVQCANSDLCEDCYKMRSEANQTGKLDHWREFCGPHHTYIKGPVAGWNGVSNGVLRIGDERLPFKDWLAGLKDERWPRAWETFWTNEIFLKNVGF